MSHLSVHLGLLRLSVFSWFFSLSLAVGLGFCSSLIFIFLADQSTKVGGSLCSLLDPSLGLGGGFTNSSTKDTTNGCISA